MDYGPAGLPVCILDQRHFNAVYKKLLMHHCVKFSGGNVESLEPIEIFFTTRVPLGRFEDTVPNNDT